MAKRRNASKKQTTAINTAHSGTVNSPKKQPTYYEDATVALATTVSVSGSGDGVGSKKEAASPRMNLVSKQPDGIASIFRTARARTVAPKPVLPLIFKSLHVTAVQSEVTDETGGVSKQEISEKATAERSAKDNTLNAPEEATSVEETTSEKTDDQEIVQDTTCNVDEKQVSEETKQQSFLFEDTINTIAVGDLSTGAVEDTIAPEETMAEQQHNTEKMFAQDIDVVHGEPVIGETVFPKETASEDIIREELVRDDAVSEDSEHQHTTAEETTMTTEDAVPEERVLLETTHKAPIFEEILPVEGIEDVELLPNELIDWRQWSAIDLADLDTQDLIEIGSFYKTAQKNDPHRQLPKWPVIILGPRDAVDTMFKKRFERVAIIRPQLDSTQQALLAARLLYKDLNPLPTPGTPEFVHQLQNKLISHRDGRLNMSSSLYIVHVDHPHFSLRRTLFALNFPGLYKSLSTSASQYNDRNAQLTCPWESMLTKEFQVETIPSHQAAFEAIGQMAMDGLSSLDTVRKAAKHKLQGWIRGGNVDKLFADLDAPFLEVQLRADNPLNAQVDMQPGIVKGLPEQQIIMSPGGLDGNASDGESFQSSDAATDLPQTMAEDEVLVQSQTADKDRSEDGDHNVNPKTSIQEDIFVLTKQSLAEDETVEDKTMAQDELVKQSTPVNQDGPTRENELLKPDNLVGQEESLFQDTPIQQNVAAKQNELVQQEGLVNQNGPVNHDEYTNKDLVMEELDSQNSSGKAGQTASEDLPANEDILKQPAQTREGDKNAEQDQSLGAAKSDSSVTLVEDIQAPEQPLGPKGDESAEKSQAEEVETITHGESAGLGQVAPLKSPTRNDNHSITTDDRLAPGKTVGSDSSARLTEEKPKSLLGVEKHIPAVANDNPSKMQTAQPMKVSQMASDNTKPLPSTDPSLGSPSKGEREISSGKTSRKGSKKKRKNTSSKSGLKAVNVAKDEFQTAAPSQTSQNASINGAPKPSTVMDRNTQTNDAQKIVPPKPNQKTLRKKNAGSKSRQNLKSDVPKHQATTPTRSSYKVSENKTPALVPDEDQKAPMQETQKMGIGKPKADVKEPAWLSIFTPESKTVVPENHTTGPSQADQEMQEGGASPPDVDLSSKPLEAEKREISSLEHVKKPAVGNSFTAMHRSSEEKRTQALSVSIATYPTESAPDDCNALLNPELSPAMDTQESQILKAFQDGPKASVGRTSSPIPQSEQEVKTQDFQVSAASQFAQENPTSDTTSTEDKHDEQQSDDEDHKKMMAQQIMAMLQPKRESKEFTRSSAELMPEQPQAQPEKRTSFSENQKLHRRSQDNGRVRKGSAPTASQSVQTAVTVHGSRRNSAPHQVTGPSHTQRPASRQQNHNQNGEQRQGGRGRKGKRKAHSHGMKETESPGHQVEAQVKSEALPNTLASTTKRQAKTLKHFLVNVIGGNDGTSSDDGTVTQVIATNAGSADASRQVSCQSQSIETSVDVGIMGENLSGPEMIEHSGAKRVTTPPKDARQISASSEKTKVKDFVEQAAVDSKDVQQNIPTRPVEEGISRCDTSVDTTSVTTQIVSGPAEVKPEVQIANDSAHAEIQATSLETAEGGAPVSLAVAAMPEAAGIAEVAQGVDFAIQTKKVLPQVCKPKSYPPPLVVDGSQYLTIPANQDPRHRHLEAHHYNPDARLSRNEPRRQPRRGSREAPWNRQPRRPRAESFAHGGRPDEQPFRQDYRQVQTLRAVRSWHEPPRPYAQFPGMLETPGRRSAHNSPPNPSVVSDSPCKNCGFSEQYQPSGRFYGPGPFEPSHLVQHQTFHAPPYNLPPGGPPMQFHHSQTQSPPYEEQRLYGAPNNQPPQLQAPQCVQPPFRPPLQNNGFHNQGPQFVPQQIPGQWSQSHSLPSQSPHSQSPQSQSSQRHPSQRYPSQRQSPHRQSPVAYPSIDHNEPTYNELGYVPRRHSPVDRARTSSVASQFAGRRSA